MNFEAMSLFPTTTATTDPAAADTSGGSVNDVGFGPPYVGGGCSGGSGLDLAGIASPSLASCLAGASQAGPPQHLVQPSAPDVRSGEEATSAAAAGAAGAWCPSGPSCEWRQPSLGEHSAAAAAPASAAPAAAVSAPVSSAATPAPALSASATSVRRVAQQEAQASLGGSGGFGSGRGPRMPPPSPEGPRQAPRPLPFVSYTEPVMSAAPGRALPQRQADLAPAPKGLRWQAAPAPRGCLGVSQGLG